ncbi:S1-like domain-containing RNA-binding protein [Brevibacillus humidisoli]|uniref:CvfB family protein n=1 Tax=Brevibacillus humidisoli TaxID=2895522 RepID=UPI001E51581B|nr:S1-like domain-containing RNA-binding protein [Brevibacillus humidisoli]UFJ41210.1 S1-like domain-containing RNA-binding protein [Brevibacillus humidisoli]
MKERHSRHEQDRRLQAGTVVPLRVARKAPFGYFVTNGDIDVLLHQNEVTSQPKEGDVVDVFLYRDQENRLAATMRMPHVREGEYGWLEVVNVVPKLGVFLDNGMAKDLLLSIDDLPKRQQEWPEEGDKVLVTLSRDKRDRLLAKPADDQIILTIARPASPEMRGRWVEGTVYNLIAEGAFVFTETEHVMFIHRDEMPRPLRIGADVYARITYVREDGRINGSLRAPKEQQFKEDADRLLAYMMKRDGTMPYTDESSPEVIRETFGLSKAAFKRAIGRLLKQGLIEQSEGRTRLRNEGREAGRAD